MADIQRTLSIVKPDAVAKGATGDILSRFEKAGLTILALKKIQLSQELDHATTFEHGDWGTGNVGDATRWLAHEFTHHQIDVAARAT